MDHTAASSQTRISPLLPDEILFNIVSHISDDSYKWMIGRQVCKQFKHEIEYQFSRHQLKATALQITTYTRNGIHWLCTFDRLSSESSRAYFKVSKRFFPASFDRLPHIPWERAHGNMFSTFVSILQHFQMRREDWRGRDERTNRLVVRVGTNVDEILLNDILPADMQVHWTDEEISMDWRRLFNDLYREEYIFTQCKALLGIQHIYLGSSMPTTSPTVVDAEIFGRIRQFQTAPDYTLRCRIRQQCVWRFTNQAGTLPLPQNQTTVGFFAVFASGLKLIIDYVYFDMIYDYRWGLDLQRAICHDRRYLVKNPVENGWRVLGRNMDGHLLWYKKDFVDPNDQGSDVHGGRGRPPPRLLRLHGLHGVTGVIQR
jgi:hypothetical protein